jgi:ATP-dependent Clp protease adapter protein ClpS
MTFRATFFHGALAGGGGVALTLSTVVHTRGSGEALVCSEEAVETAASGPLAGPVAGS